MRTLKLFLAALGFLTYFVGMVALSAVSTSLIYLTIFPRIPPVALADRWVLAPTEMGNLPLPPQLSR